MVDKPVGILHCPERQVTAFSGTAGVRHRAVLAIGGRFMVHVILLLTSVVTLGPFLWMLLSSFKDTPEIVRQPPVLLPTVWRFENYVRVFTELDFNTAFRNSTLVAVVATSSTLFTSSLAAYVFAKYRFFGREQIFVVILGTMMIPFSVTMIPLFVIATRIGLNDNLLGLIVPGVVNTFGIFLMRQFIEGIPSELIDAGRIDGASEWWIYSRIIVPLSSSALSALAIFTFMAHWDSFMWPLVIISSPENRTLPLALVVLLGYYWGNWSGILAGAVVTVLPILAVYTFAQQHFIRGIALTGVKG